MPDYDLVVIGSGPAGERGAAQAAYFGKKVAVVEREPLLGGAGTNTGTLPSKTLRETALFLSGFRQRGLHAVDLSLKRRATVRDLMHRERLVTASERGRIARNLERHGIEVLAGTASFVDAHTIRLHDEEEGERLVSSEVFLIATGSRPHRPEAFELDDPRILDSNTVLELESIPDSLAVVGGGVIGCEYACMFAALDIDVDLVEGRSRLLRFVDGEIAGILRSHMESLDVRFRMPDRVRAVDTGGPQVSLTLESGETLSAGMVLVASGRNGNTGGLGLEALGIQVGKRGHVEVDSSYRTAVPNIYAAGDVVGFPALASTAMEQARIAMVHAFDLKYKTDLAPILPYGIYTIPELSMAGETEESLREKGIDFVAGRASYADNARGQIIGDGGGLLKLLFRREDMRLLGVHIIGEQASELVHIGLTALLTEATSELFIRSCYNFPTLSETYKYATYEALGRRESPEDG